MVQPLIVAIASDHAGVTLKAVLKSEMESGGHQVIDLGTDGNTSVDYPDFADKIAEALKLKKAALGVLICGSGIGISIAANRHRHIRAALCHDATSARLSRMLNDANVLALGARLIGDETAKDCVRAFLSTAFEGGRHQTRVDKLT